MLVDRTSKLLHQKYQTENLKFIEDTLYVNFDPTGFIEKYI